MAQHGDRRWQQARAAARSKVAAAAAATPVPSSTAGAALLSAEELLHAIEAVFPVETPEPAGLLASITLRPYQRQSLAFALQVRIYNHTHKHTPLHTGFRSRPLPTAPWPAVMAQCVADGFVTRWAWVR